MPQTSKEKQNSKYKKGKPAKESDTTVFDEFVGYLGKGRTDRVMKELRGGTD